MPTKFIQLLCICAAVCMPALGTSIPAGFISWDVTTPGATAQFDIANETGPNASGDPTAPITTAVGFTDLKLAITFDNATKLDFSGSDLTLNAFDGLSWESPESPIGGSNPLPTRAVLTGDFAVTSVTLFDRSHGMIGAASA